VQHGLDIRGLTAGANQGVPYGRFGTMFDLTPNIKLSDAALVAIAEAMIKKDPGAPITETESVDENATIPAGYTYFGQFVDHDITFDPTPLSAEQEDPDALVDFRTPALDLDNIYGRGPDDQPYMYDGVKLRVGRNPGNANAAVGTKNDLFRILDNTVPILGDKRNDENKIVSQIHGALMAFHNKVVDSRTLMTWAGADLNDPRQCFDAAVSIVRWHYQWVVVFDYLERICEPGMVMEVLNPGGAPRIGHYAKLDAKYAYMPVEFSGAAFRFGHSMVRPSYALNRFVGTQPGPDDPKDETTPRRIPTFTIVKDPAHPTPEEQLLNLNGFPGTLPDQWGIDWGYFLDGITANVALPKPPKPGETVVVPQPSYRIDALLSDPLKILPEFQAVAGQQASAALMNLAFRNLRRGQLLDLPSGEAVACRLGIVPMPPEVVWGAGSYKVADQGIPPELQSDFDKTIAARKGAFESITAMGYPLAGHTPLWYYILREAEHYGVTKNPNDPAVACGGQHLGPVGSRIVAETLIGMLHYDRSSFLHCMPAFRPHPEITGSAASFTLDRLITYALS
jgi:hypothetical protein